MPNRTSHRASFTGSGRVRVQALARTASSSSAISPTLPEEWSAYRSILAT